MPATTAQTGRPEQTGQPGADAGPSAPEMRLYSATGERLYLDAGERAAFLSALDAEAPANRMYGHVLHYTGCRPTEALQLTVGRVLIAEQALVLQSLKKRRIDNRGRERVPQYRTVPVPAALIESLDLVFNLRARQRRPEQTGRPGANRDAPLWAMSRPTAWRLIKRVMARANIQGRQATGKGLRHGFGVAMVTAGRPLPIHVLSQLMGHASTKVTEIYLQMVGEEQRRLVMEAWEHQTGSSPV